MKLNDDMSRRKDPWNSSTTKNQPTNVQQNDCEQEVSERASSIWSDMPQYILLHDKSREMLLAIEYHFFSSQIYIFEFSLLLFRARLSAEDNEHRLLHSFIEIISWLLGEKRRTGKNIKTNIEFVNILLRIRMRILWIKFCLPVLEKRNQFFISIEVLLAGNMWRKCEQERFKLLFLIHCLHLSFDFNRN